MAGTISFSGLSASGLDTSSWVDALVSVKQQTVTSLEAQKTEKENLLSIVNNIKSYFSSFQSCLQKLTDSQYGIASMDLFMQNLALSSNANIATATATTEAARQSYDVAVDSLATATKATSGYSQFEVKTADLNTTFGTLGGKNGTITVNSQSFNVTTDDTLGSLVDKFKNVGVDASFDEKKGTFTVGIDLDKIDEGATNLKNALKLKNNNVSGAVSGSIVYANRSTEFSKLGLTAGKITIEGIEHTIAKNGDNYTIQKAGGSAVSMNTLGEFFDYLKSSAVGAEDASVDGKGNITIKGATLDKVEGGSNLMEVLNLIESQKRTVSESGALSYVEVRNADLNTKLSALGVTGDTTLVAGGTNNTISNDKTLGDIQKILKNAGVEMNVDNRGVITIDTKGNEISGTLLDVLNLDPTKGGTTISSSAHQANLKADLNTKLSELGVKDSDKYIAYKSDGTAVTVEMTNLSDKSINTLITDLKNVGLDANFDEKTHQIVIKDGYITGTLADVLGMTQSTTSYTENATLNTTLSALGATGDSTLTIDGGSAKTYGKDTTLETVFNDIKDAGGKVTFKDGNVTIEGVTLGGSIPALLGLDATTQGTSVTSGKLTAVTGSSSTGGGNNATVEHDIDLNTKIGDITGTTSSYTLKVDDGTSKTYTKDTTLQELKNQIESAGGKFTINDDNTISIDGVTMSGTLVGVLGFDELETGTRFTTVDSVMISGTSNVATGDTTLGNLGLISGSTSGARAVRRAPANPNKTLSINGGTAKSYGANSSLDDIFADIVAAGGTASIDDEGYINIKGVHLEGTLVDALGLVETDYKTTITSGNLKVTTSTSSTSSSVLYSEQKGDISLNSTVGSIVGDSESYNLVVNGTNNTIGTNTKLSDIRTIIQNAGGTMTVNDDNTISVNGVEISGSLVDKLGFMSNGVHTVVSSNNPIYYTDGKKSADSGSTFEQLGISADKRDFAIYKNDGTLVKASSTTGSASGKTIGDWLKTINDALNSANGTSGSVYATINNGVISISGGYVTGSLPTELGIGTTQTVTGITMEGNSVTYTEYDPLKYIGNIQTGSGTAAGNVTSTGMIGAVVEYTDEAGNVLQANENTKLADILDTSGNKLGSGSFTFNVGSYTKTFDADSTTLGDVRDYVNNLNTDTTYDTNTSASIADGKIAIESNVDITGTLMSALGFAKSDVSSIAYEIKGTNKAHYSKSEGVTVTASGFSTGVTTQSTSGTDKVYVSSLSDFVSGSTYYVKSASDLNKLAELTNAGKDTKGVTFVLENDVDLAGQQFVPIGTYNNTFKGNFYGNGHVIKNLTITDTSVLSEPFTSGSSKVYHAGLFGMTNGAKLYDIGLENVNINLSIDGVEDGVWAGALVGYEQYSEINNCYSTGSVSADAYAGGLVGVVVLDSSVSNSYSTVNVSGKSIVGGLVANLGGKISNSFATGNVNGSSAGGLVGYVSSSTISNSFATGNVSASEGSKQNGAGGLVGYAFSGNITISDSFAMGNVTGTASQGGVVGIDSATTTVTNCGYSGSTGLASGVTSGATAMTDAQLKSSIEGLGISSATVVNKTVDTTAELTTTIKDLIGKGGSQTLTLTPTAGGSQVELTFNDTDTIQTVIDKLKAQGIDEADLTDGVFRIKDDKQWTISGALANKLFGGADDVYTFTGSKVTYTTTGAGTAGSVTGNKVTYETTGSGTVGSVTGDKLTYTVSTTDGSIVSNEMLYKKLANNSMSISGNKVTYTGTGSGSSGFVLSPDMTDDPSRWQVVFDNGINGNSTLSEILKKNDYIFEDFEAGELLSKDGIAIDGLTADMTLNQLCEKLGWEYSNHTLTAISNTETYYSGRIIDALFQGEISINPEDTATKTYLSSVSGNLSTGKSYWIKSVEDLQKLATYSQNNDTSRMYFVLDNDIDMSGVNFDGISNFQGEFYGQGHTISNLTTSLFNSVSGANALVKDIGLLNSNVMAFGDATGLLAGSVSGGATIMNCYVTGELAANGRTVGGLVGTITDNALISCSSANVTISGNRGDGSVIGGLVGEASGNAHIRYSHSSGSIGGSTGTVGGFVGQLKGSVAISNGYTTVDVDIVDCNFYGAFAGSICEQVGSGGVEAIGFSGTLSNVFATADVPFASTMDFEDGAIIENVIYNSEANTTTYQPALFANNATGLTLAQMQDGSTMQNYGFNLENLWNTSNGIPDFTDPTASNSKIVATGSTTMAQLGITDFTINGEALSGINANSTVVDVFTALKNEYGIEASISNGTVTFSATSDNYLEGEIINKFFGSKAVEFSTGLNGNSIKSNKVQYSTTETTYRDVYNQFDILPESTNSTKIFDLYVQSMASPSGKKISSGSITVGSVTFTIDASTTVADLKRFLAREDCYLDSVDGGGGSLYRIVSNNGSSVSVSGDIANDGSSSIGYLCTKSTVSAGETVNHNIDNNTTIGQIFGDTASHTIKVGGETVTLQSTDKLSTLVSKLADKGVTAEIKNSALYLTTSNSTVFSGDIISRFFGQDKVIAGGSTYKYVDIELSTKFSDMEYDSNPVFEVDGTKIDGLTKDSTIQDLFNKLASKGINASLSNGKITLTSDTEHTLTGTAVEDFFGGAVTVGSSSTTTTHTATENTTLGELGLTSFDLKINGTSTSGLSADSKISDVFAKLADSNITATMTDGKITLTSNEATTLSGTVAEKLLGSSSVTLAGDSTEHTFDMEQISASKALYTSRALTYNSGAQKVSDVTELVAGNKYHIASEADLVKLAEFVNSGADTTGSIFIFDNDIDMSSVANFTSIGNDASHAFKGTIYGNGHVVKNLKIDSTSDYQGLFGYVQQATIQDLGVEDANIKGGAYSGILVGRAENAKLTNLYATGTVSGSSFVGGLVGSLKDSVLEKSYSTATVNVSKAAAGGLVGSVVNSTLETVYATGDVNCTASGVGALAGTGGLVGTMQSGGTIKNAFATGSVTTKSGGFNGGLIGWLTDSSSYTIDTVYATGNVTGSGGTNGGLIGTINASSVTITNAIYNKNSVSNGVGNGSPDGITGKNFEQMLMKSVMQNAGFTEDKGWVYKDGATPTFGNMTVSGGGGKVYLDDTITSFTSGSAYYISSLEQLNKLASLVNSGASTVGVSFILENDIDVSAFTTAIGSDTNAFEGTFYGNGHVLTGLKTNLFDNIDGEAVIRDIGLENMTGSGHLASSVVGNSTIDNVYSTGSATVAGLVNKLGGSATIKNSYSTATVNSSSASAGGLVAQMEGSATIEKSYFSGRVQVGSYYTAGGLVGSMAGGTIKSSYSTASIASGDVLRGGLVGEVTGSVTIQNSYASGTADGGFIGINSGSVTSTGNVYNSANTIAVGSGSSISGLTAISLADMKSQSKMEALGFTASNGWHYYAGKTPMLQGQDISSGHSANVSLSTKIDSILNSGDGRNVKVTANGTTYEKWFEPTDTVKDVRDWLNTIDGVTATFDETNSTFKVSGTSEDFKIDGDLASALFGGRKTTTKTSATVNTDSNELLVDGSQTKITNNTTVGQLLGKASGNYAIGFYDDNGNLVTKNFGVDTKLSEVLQYLKDNGFEASITNGVFTATKDGNTTTDILGTIGNKLKGETGTVTTTDTGYQTGVLGSSSSVKATASTKLSELGIDSGSILIKDNNNNNLGTIQINNSMTIDDTAQLLANYGFTLTITDGKVTVAGEGINRLADGTSNLVSKMKLDNWTETKDKLKTTSTVAQMGFAKGATLGLVLDSKTYNLTFDANATLQDIIDTLGTYGVTASVDSDGKFTATASGNLVLTNELGAYLTKNSAEGYVKEADGYKSKDPLEFKGDKVKLDYDSKVGDILGTGKDGVLRLTIDNTTVVDLRYRADETMSDIIADLKGYGITATINDGVLTAVSDGHTFRFSGEIGKIISGDTPLYEDISTGYKSKDLSYETTGKATLDNTLKEMGISSGQIHVLSNDGKIVSTLDVDDSYTVAQVKSLLQPFGMDLAIDADGKVTVTSSEGYKLSDGTSNMVSTMKLNSWTTTTEKLTGATTLSQMGFKDGADLNLFLDGAVMNVLSFNADQTLDDISFALSAYGIDASVNADGQFTATSKTHTFIMSGGLGSYLTKGTGGYVNSDTAYKSYKPLTEEHPYITDTSKELGYKKLMTESSTLDSLGFAQGGSVRIMLDGTTPYSLEFLATDTVQDVIYALSAYGINAEVKDGKFVAESVNNTFTITGNFGSYLVQGGAYNNEVTGYESAPLTYNTTEKLTNDTKLSSLGVTRGAINVIKDGKVADTINITNDTTIGQLFSAIKPYGMSGSIVTDASGNTSIRISADSDIKLADGTSNVVSALGLHDVRQGDFEGHKEYWDDDATSGLITEGMLLSSLDRNGFIAQGSLIFTTGEGDDAVQHIINITADETVGSLLKKFNDSGIKAELDNGIIKLTGGLDKLTFNGGTSGLVNTIGLDIHNIDKYASSSSALTYEGETHYSASNFANANTTLDIVNTTDGIMSVFVDGIKCNVEVKSSDTFAKLFKKIKDTVKAKSGLDIEAGFMTKDGTISTNPTDANNTGIIALSVAEGHELVIGASNDTTNFATIANLNKTGYNTITGSRALYRVNVNSLITQSGLYRDGDITEGTFIIGDAEFTIDSTTTLSSLIEQINKNDKAYANAYWDTLSGTLVIQSTNTGASLINIEAGTSNFTDIMGFTKTKDGVSALVTDSQTLGQNAVVRINGTTVTSATNVITSDISRIKGLTINLKNVSEGETVTITVEQDKESIYNAVSDTLDSYNAMMEALNKELSDRSSLGGESILKLMRNNLKRLMTSSLTGAYVFKNLASVGISTGQASDDISTNVTSLLIDKDKFMDALNTDSDAVQDLLVGTKANPGIFLQANNIVESSIKTDGYFSNMANTLTKSINNIDKKITKTNNDIENYRTKLQSKFHNMELTISGLQSAYANLLGQG